MKDYIDVINDSGNTIKMEVVTIFKLNSYDFNYIIYKEIDDSHYYIGKYKGNDIVNLDTNLSSKELELANFILEGVIKDETTNK